MSKTDFYAYVEGDEDRSALEAVMRFHSVKRWHMIDTTRIQTLAEHSANVALLAWYIAHTSPLVYFGTASGAAACGLLHDLPEVFTGDIPSHTKRHLDEEGHVARLEQRVLPAVFDIIQMESCRQLVKICDIADGIRFIRLHGVDITAQHAQDGLEDQLERLKAVVEDDWPEAVFEHVFKNVMFYAYEFS